MSKRGKEIKKRRKGVDRVKEKEWAAAPKTKIIKHPTSRVRSPLSCQLWRPPSCLSVAHCLAFKKTYSSKCPVPAHKACGESTESEESSIKKMDLLVSERPLPSHSYSATKFFTHHDLITKGCQTVKKKICSVKEKHQVKQSNWPWRKQRQFR